MSALLTTDAAAAVLQLSPRTVRRMCAAGLLPHERQIGRRGARSGGVYLIPDSALHQVAQAKPTAITRPSEVQPPISIGTFLARGGADALRTVSSRREFIELARAVTGPNRTAQLQAIADQAKISLSTLYRWMDLKGEDQTSLERAVKTIRPKFDEQGMRRRISVEPEAREYFHTLYLQMNNQPVPTVIYQYTLEAVKRGWSVPSRATFYRLVTEDLSRFERDLARGGISKVKGQLLPKNTLTAPTHKHKVWLADSRPHDFWVAHPETGEPIRPRLTAFIDGCTRVLVGYAAATAPDTATTRRAFTMAVYPEAPFDQGLPEFLLEDNGSEFTNKVIVDMLQGVGVKQYNCEVGAGWAKGAIESFFKTLSNEFDRTMPTWTGHNPMARPEGLNEKKLAAEGRLMTWAQYEEMLKNYVEHYNKERAHNGDGMDGKTPLQRYQEVPSASIGLPSTKAMELLFTKEEQRMVTKDGIKLFNDLFFHDALYSYGNRIHRPVVGEYVTVRYNPEDKTQAHVFYEGEYVCTVSIKDRPAFDPEDKENMALAGRIHSTRRRLVKDGLEKLHGRAEACGLSPWLPPRDGKVNPPSAEEQMGLKAPRMITKMDRVAQQIEDQQKKDTGSRQGSEEVSALLQRLGNRLA